MSRKTEKTTSLNTAIGLKIREYRSSLGWSRDVLAKKINVTHQQLQKYERGTNNVSAARLSMLAEALGVPIEVFYALPTDVLVKGPMRKSLELSRHFLKLQKRAHQDAVLAMVRTIATS